MNRVFDFTTLAGLLPAVTLLAACGDAEQVVEERLRPVRYVTISDDAAGRDRSFTGTLKSTQESRLSFKVSGTATRVPVEIGDTLDAGDLIAELDATNYSLQVEQAQAALVEAQAQERNANATYERTKGLYANDNASLNELDSTRAAAEAAKAQVRAATKALEIARLNESYTRLYASADCSIASMDLEVNENVSPGQTIAVVACGDDFEVDVDVPESVISNVDRYTPVSIVFNAIGGMRFSGEVTQISTSGTGAVFPVVVRVNEQHPALRSGLAAEVTFQFDVPTIGGTFILPVAAVANDADGVYVLIAEPAEVSGEAVVSRRPVVIGELTQSGVEVISGLEPGDLVVTAGVSVIRAGQRVLLP